MMLSSRRLCSALRRGGPSTAVDYSGRFRLQTAGSRFLPIACSFPFGHPAGVAPRLAGVLAPVRQKEIALWLVSRTRDLSTCARGWQAQEESSHSRKRALKNLVGRETVAATSIRDSIAARRSFSSAASDGRLEQRSAKSDISVTQKADNAQSRSGDGLQGNKSGGEKENEKSSEDEKPRTLRGMFKEYGMPFVIVYLLLIS